MSRVRWGSDSHHARTIAPKPDKRWRPRWCPFCRWRRPATHYGYANGIALVAGCLTHVRKWQRDPRAVDPPRRAP